MDLLQILQPEPLGGESRAQRLGAGVRQHSPYLPLEHTRIREFPLTRECHEVFVRGCGPEEERQARRQVDVADSIALTRLDTGGRLLEAEHEIGARQNRLQGRPDSGLEATFPSTGLVERHQGIEIVVGEWSPEGPRPQPGDDLFGARQLFAEGSRAAREDPSAARRLRNAYGVVRPVDDQILQVG